MISQAKKGEAVDSATQKFESFHISNFWGLKII